MNSLILGSAQRSSGASAWLTQTQASDPGGWTVTTFIALIGAVISLATLFVTTWAAGRRERAKWARESLAEAFYEFIEASFRTRDRLQDVQELLWKDNEEPSIVAARLALKEQRTALRHAQTKIVLLAPGSTAERAQDLRRHLKRFGEALRPDMSRDEWDRWTGEIRGKREVLIVGAKKSMSLPR